MYARFQSYRIYDLRISLPRTGYEVEWKIVETDVRNSSIVFSIDAAIALFATARTVGIYKQDYLDALWRKFGDGTPEKISAPPRPNWCVGKKANKAIEYVSLSLVLLGNSEDEDEPGQRSTGGNKRASSNAEEQPSKRSREESAQVRCPTGEFTKPLYLFS